MSAPFIFIRTHTVKPGQLEAFKEYFADFCDNVVEPNEPRLLSFQAYADPESNQVTVVQIHPDAESMVHHMSVIAQHVTHRLRRLPRARKPPLADLRHPARRRAREGPGDGR